MRISFESPNQADAIALIAELDAYQSALYPPESHHALDLTSVAGPGLVFVMARDDAQQAVGCGAVVLSPEYGELKRMYVRPQQRGLGIAQKIVQTLEAAAFQANCRMLKLESGPYQPEALALYKRCGYERCGPFGAYSDDPLSVFMQKTLLVPDD
jgi:putative acetyltransferase